MRTSRLSLTLATIVIGGFAYAAIAPQEMVQPSQEHKTITSSAGNWAGTLSWYMPGMDEAQTSPCSETTTVVGDLWAVGHFSMESPGGAFTGVSTVGFDPNTKKYIGTWIDSMSTRITHMEGEYDEAAGAIVMTYEMFDVMSGEMKQMRQENRSTADVYDLKFYEVGADGDRLSMEINMTRSKAVEAGAKR